MRHVRMENGNKLMTMNMMTTTGAYGSELENKMIADEIRNAEMVKELETRYAVNHFTTEDPSLKSVEGKHVQPNGYTVIFTKYERNPYRQSARSASGLILDTGYDSHEYEFSHETGQMERNDLGIICCNVVAVGPECKYVKPGEDIYLRNVGIAPVPFGGRDYWAISEQNIICRVVND